MPNGSHVAIINSVIADNACTNIAQCGYGLKFINTTIANNDCSAFLETYLVNNPDLYEIKNSIVTNTYTWTIGPWAVDVYNSIVDDFSYFNDNGGNHAGVPLDFTSNDVYNPYACEPNQYLTARGNAAYIVPYLQYLNDYYDIIGIMRLSGQSIDIGAYQGPQIYYSPMLAPAPEMDIEHLENPDGVRIYPTSVYSGESVYIENSFESPFTARVYNMSGMELYSVSLSSQLERISLPLPAGVYIMTVTDDSTSERLRQEKIIIRN
jgi:hypothetical protein